MSHDLPSSQVNEARDAISETIECLGIDLVTFHSLCQLDRISYITELIPELKKVYAKPSGSDNQNLTEGKSIALIKPEIFPRDEELLDELAKRGYNFTDRPRLVHPTSEQWLELYGYMIPKFPDILQNYIVHRALGFKVINLVDMDESRIQILNQETGNAYEKDRDTIRGGVSRLIMGDLGFHAMTGYASAFDPLGFIRGNTQQDYVFRCYNGIHTPKNTAEAVCNMETFHV